MTAWPKSEAKIRLDKLTETKAGERITRAKQARVDTQRKYRASTRDERQVKRKEKRLTKASEVLIDTVQPSTERYITVQMRIPADIQRRARAYAYGLDITIAEFYARAALSITEGVLISPPMKKADDVDDAYKHR
jgi:hypothetical protein